MEQVLGGGVDDLALDQAELGVRAGGLTSLASFVASRTEATHSAKKDEANAWLEALGHTRNRKDASNAKEVRENLLRAMGLPTDKPREATTLLNKMNFEKDFATGLKGEGEPNRIYPHPRFPGEYVVLP